MNLIKFKRDTSFRKQFFVPNSFSHPAKMDAQLLIWLVEKYSKVGETILDPMFGSGTLMLACMLGRHVIGVELESKFCDMAKANWGVVRQHPQLGYSMGECQIIQGDARNLGQVLADSIITSPPYENVIAEGDAGPLAHASHNPDFKDKRQGYTDKVDSIITSPPYASGGTKADENPENYIRREEERLKLFPNRPKTFVGRYSGDRDNLGNLPYGSIDSVITSPPFSEAHNAKGLGVGDNDRADLKAYSYLKSPNPANIGNLPHGDIDSIITSPPYEGSIIDGNENFEGMRHLGTISKENIDKKREQLRAYQFGKDTTAYGKKVDSIITSPPYEEVRPNSSKEPQQAYTSALKGDIKTSKVSEEGNIGNLKSDSYLSAMLQVYTECFRVLKPQGLLILVTKNFIRNQKEVRLDEDTIKLCEKSGFVFKERWYRELPSQSFWRVIYKKKYPNAPELKYEDILVFGK